MARLSKQQCLASGVQCATTIPVHVQVCTGGTCTAIGGEDSPTAVHLRQTDDIKAAEVASDVGSASSLGAFISAMYVRRMSARLVRSKGHLLKSASLGTGLTLGFVLWVKLMLVSPRSSLWTTCADPDVSNVIKLSEEEEESLPGLSAGRDSLVYVGVMTAKKHLDNRVVAAQETWVRDLPGKVEFFSSAESAGAAPEGVPVVALKGVTDAYPPMKKSFLMLKYMYDHYVDEFDWFVRADDDVYIKGDRLGRFLRSLDASESLAIGQPGFGRPEDRVAIGFEPRQNYCMGGTGVLFSRETFRRVGPHIRWFGRPEDRAAMRFEPRQNYCMGGTGVLFSRETLRLVGPHIRWCLGNLYSVHDDVEFGRCFYNVANVTCSRAYDCQDIFLNNYEGYKEGSIGDFKKPAVLRALTLHPNKLPENQYRFQMYLLSQRMRDARHRTLVLSREIRHVTVLLSEGEISLDASPEERRSPSFLIPDGAENSSYWEYFKVKGVFKVNGNLTYKMAEEMKAGLRDIVTQLTENLNPDRWKTTTSIRALSSGYIRVTPGQGVQYVLDLRMRREGRDTRQYVRLQQTFVTPEFTETDESTTTEGEGARRVAQLEEGLHWGVPDNALC
ncbi:CHSY1 [Branchiostoma lanceolatum]|uniref:Hexosyltransferase n=1 Tax=Branchiostoma lanceolatum TaxID=7740 RepID=A0A8K0EZX0_BRALA|nr:CHSY1 [Branchiostoma lanceolatum]